MFDCRTQAVLIDSQPQKRNGEPQHQYREHLDTLNNYEIVSVTRLWLEEFVIELNLCPFAKRELENDRVRFSVTNAKSEQQLLVALKTELELLDNNTDVETTLLIHPSVLMDFYTYNQFLTDADNLLLEQNLNGIYQIASFHPDYQFADTHPDDAENFTNRSPYPMLHILSEDSLERAIGRHPDTEQIPLRNIETMNQLGKHQLLEKMQDCFNRATDFKPKK